MLGHGLSPYKEIVQLSHHPRMCAIPRLGTQRHHRQRVFAAFDSLRATSAHMPAYWMPSPVYFHIIIDMYYALSCLNTLVRLNAETAGKHSFFGGKPTRGGASGGRGRAWAQHGYTSECLRPVRTTRGRNHARGHSVSLPRGDRITQSGSPFFLYCCVLPYLTRKLEE